MWCRKYENLFLFNTSWLASLRTWYYFRLLFSLSCSGYDLMLITKSHTLNCYLLLLKFLLNTKSLLVTVVAQFTAKTTNSEKAIYFLSLTSCSVNRPKSQMLITCKDFIFSDFTWKKIFAPGNGGWVGAPLPPCPPLSLRSCIGTIRKILVCNFHF